VRPLGDHQLSHPELADLRGRGYLTFELSRAMPSSFLRGRNSRAAQSPYANMNAPKRLVFAADRESGHAEYAEYDTGR
jgi:hypothetical protein